MKKTQIIVLSGYGLNCEEETKFAFEYAGGEASIVHINDLIEKPSLLRKFDILAVPGGFSYGDDTGSGKAYANKLKNHLLKDIQAFAKRDTLIIGICNGFQILTQLGLLPGALMHNESARYLDRWVDLEVCGNSPWLNGIEKISLPIAHGEGNYIASKETLKKLNSSNSIAFRYVNGEMSAFQNLLANPNGATENIAGVLSENGRILGIMPHPERAIFVTQLPNWPLLKEQLARKGKKLPKEGPGITIFKNAIRYFK